MKKNNKYNGIFFYCHTFKGDLGINDFHTCSTMDIVCDKFSDH